MQLFYNDLFEDKSFSYITSMLEKCNRMYSKVDPYQIIGICINLDNPKLVLAVSRWDGRLLKRTP